MATRGWQNVTADQLRQLTRAGANPSKPRKYRNVVVEVGGQRFDSRAEAEYWLLLEARCALGEIRDLRRQVSFPLFAVNKDGWHTQVCVYIADFVYVDRDGRQHVVDLKRKATRTAVYQLKRKWLALQDGIEIEEVG